MEDDFKTFDFITGYQISALNGTSESIRKAATGYTVTAFHVPFLYHSHHKDSEIKTSHCRLFDISKQLPAADWVFLFSPLIFHTDVSGGEEELNTNCTQCTGLLQW